MKKILPLIFGLFFFWVKGYGEAPIVIVSDHFSGLITKSMLLNTENVTRENNPIISESLSQPMEGTYTIGGTDGTYPDFSGAVTDLEKRGAQGTVIFKVRPGIYQEHLHLTSSFEQVIFEGESNDSTKVILNYDGESALFIEGASNYTFRHMTISGSGNAVKIFSGEMGTTNVVLENNILKGGKSHAVIEAYAEGRGARNNNHFYRNNLIIGEGTGINKTRDTHEDPRSGGRNSDDNLEITGNIIQAKGTGIYLYAQEQLKINNNSVIVENTADAGATKGIALSFVFQLKELNQNEIKVNGAGAEGLLVSGAHLPERMLKNRIFLPDGGTGIHFGHDFIGWVTPTLVANNMISVKGNQASNGILLNNLRGTPAFYNNSVLIYGEGADSKALSLVQEYSAYQVELLNNIFANKAGGLAIYAEKNQDQELYPINNSDYNVIYSSGKLLAKWVDQGLADLGQWQSATTFDLHSLPVDPQFESKEILRPQNALLDGAGVSISPITEDFFGHPRSTPPDLGAVEFSKEAPDPLAGSYTIGGAGADFHSFQEAVTALKDKGVSGVVTFKVRPGIYPEQLILPEGIGSCDVPIVFEGETSDSTKVALEGNGVSVLIEGADGISLRSMMMNGIRIMEGSNCITLENNHILGSITSTSGAGELANDYHVYHKNYISQGITSEKSGQFNPDQPEFDEGLVVSGNIAHNTIALHAQKGIKVNYNSITPESEYFSGAGISLTNSWYGKEMIGNQISISSYHGEAVGIKTVSGIPEKVIGNAISLYEGEWESGEHADPILGGGTGLLVSTGKGNDEVLIANNRIGVSGWDRHGLIRSFFAVHIKETYSQNDKIKVYHNSMGTSGYIDYYKSAALLVGDMADSSLYLLNNTYADMASGDAIRIQKPASVVVSDYNYYPYGTFNWGGKEVSSLEAWQTLVGMDEHSISSGSIAGAGIKVEEVDTDFNGKLRPNPPSIGPVEQGNVVPVVNAGSDKTITLPQDSIVLRGTGRDRDGRFVAFLWEKVSGPTVSMLKANTANAVVKDLVPGEYVFRFSATDNDGATSSDEMGLIVKSGNQLPVVNAGADKTVFLPLESLSISGTGYDPDGRFTAFLWEKVSGPSVTMSQQRTANLRLTDLVEGSYVFCFSATDNAGATVSDEMALTIKWQNQPPVVSAGTDKTITLPVGKVTLSGTGYDPDGRFTAFLWEKISGPAVTIERARTANVELSELVEGTYVFRFSATDNGGATSSDEMRLMVKGTGGGKLAGNLRVSAYPNVFQDYINIKIETEIASCHIEVFDALGITYYQNHFVSEAHDSRLHRIDLSNKGLRKGTYFVRIVNGTDQQVLRVVKVY